MVEKWLKRGQKSPKIDFFDFFGNLGLFVEFWVKTIFSMTFRNFFGAKFRFLAIFVNGQKLNIILGPFQRSENRQKNFFEKWQKIDQKKKNRLLAKLKKKSQEIDPPTIFARFLADFRPKNSISKKTD